MARSPKVGLAMRLERIKQLAHDLARAQGAESLVSRAMADRIKRDVNVVRRALERSKP